MHKEVCPPVPLRSYRQKWEFAHKTVLRPRVPLRPWHNDTCTIISRVTVPGATVRIDLQRSVSRPFAVYFVQVAGKHGFGWTVEKRYSDFYRFWKDVQISGNATLPSLPSRFSLGRVLNQEFIEMRRQGLSYFLQEVLHLCKIHRNGNCFLQLSKSLEDFLEVSNRRKQSFHLERKFRITTEIPVLRGQAMLREILKRHGRGPRNRIRAGTNCSEDLARMVAMEWNRLDNSASKLLKHLQGSSANERTLENVHRFLATSTQRVVQKHQLDKRQDFDELSFKDTLYRLFEVAFFERHQEVKDSITSLAGRGIMVNDDIVETKAAILAARYGRTRIAPSIFGAQVHPNFSIGASFWGWQSAVECLERLNENLLPSSLVDVLLQCIEEIHLGFKAAERTKGSGPRVIGGDEFIPTFFFILASADLHRPCTKHKFMSSLASAALMETEAKYWLTVMESGLFFLQNLKID